MKYRSFGLLLVLSILSCGFSSNAPQYSAISKAIALIEKYTKTNRQLINLRIVNTHNGSYTINSKLWTGVDSVRLMTLTGEEYTVLNLSKKDFLFKLNRASIVDDSYQIMGHRQTIWIKKADQEEVFETEDGQALMNLLRYGE